MKLESYNRRAPWINLSALIDVLFILLVFVILAANFETTRALEVQLPTSDATAPLEKSAVRLEVDADARLRVNGRPVARAALLRVLSTARRRADTIAIIADRDLPLSVATDLLSITSRAGFESVSIATQPRTGTR